MGSHGREGVERFLLGNTAERVLRKVPSPVLVLREALERGARAKQREEVREHVPLLGDATSGGEQLLGVARGAQLGRAGRWGGPAFDRPLRAHRRRPRDASVRGPRVFLIAFGVARSCPGVGWRRVAVASGSCSKHGVHVFHEHLGIRGVRAAAYAVRRWH